MRNPASEKLSSRIIAIGLTTVTIAVFTQSVTDPVNVTKLFLLGGFAFAAIGSCAKNLPIVIRNNHRIPIMAVFFFLIAAVSTLLASNAPFSQSLYGVYGRNNGFILYLLLALIFIAALSIETKSLFAGFLVALAVAGVTNILYAFWVLAFGDFVGWSNPYGNLLGTLGNPNFIGSFFGMFAALLFSFALAPTSTTLIRFSSLLMIPFVFFGIVQSHAVQGKVLFVAGFTVAMFYWIRDRFNNRIVHISYLATVAIGFGLALLGTLQKGPLTAMLYKESVSLRGEYWYSGWKTGLANPIFGAGFDSLGDWYRRTRRDTALKLPGIDTVINTAHNVFLDMFAFGGWPLLISYVIVVLIVMVSIARFTIRNRKFDPTFVSLTGVWLCYQLQSTISINQIGLAIWGWTFGAAIIAYEVADSKKLVDNFSTKSVRRQPAEKFRQSTTSDAFSPGLVAALASVVGLIIAAPPLSADTKWRSAQISQSAEQFEDALQPGYLNPNNSYELNSIVGVFEANGLTDLAHLYGVKAVKFNPDNYESWRILYLLSKSTNDERALALSNMKRLDPLNPNVGAVNG
jgi:hypothetical protein